MPGSYLYIEDGKVGIDVSKETGREAYDPNDPQVITAVNKFLQARLNTWKAALICEIVGAVLVTTKSEYVVIGDTIHIDLIFQHLSTRIE